MSAFSYYIMPCSIGIIIILGIYKKVSIFEIFTAGAKEGLTSTVSIAPTLIGLLVAVSMLRASGFFDIVGPVFLPITKIIGIPNEVIPLIFLRPISGSGSLALVDSILKNCGPDSFAGRVASVVMCSIETAFYSVAVYFGSIGIKNTRYTLLIALTSYFVSVIMSILMVRILFNN